MTRPKSKRCRNKLMSRTAKMFFWCSYFAVSWYDDNGMEVWLALIRFFLCSHCSMTFLLRTRPSISSPSLSNWNSSSISVWRISSSTSTLKNMNRPALHNTEQTQWKEHQSCLWSLCRFNDMTAFCVGSNQPFRFIRPELAEREFRKHRLNLPQFINNSYQQCKCVAWQPLLLDVWHPAKVTISVQQLVYELLGCDKGSVGCQESFLVEEIWNENALKMPKPVTCVPRFTFLVKWAEHAGTGSQCFLGPVFLLRRRTLPRARKHDWSFEKYHTYRVFLCSRHVRWARRSSHLGPQPCRRRISSWWAGQTHRRRRAESVRRSPSLRPSARPAGDSSVASTTRTFSHSIHCNENGTRAFFPIWSARKASQNRCEEI